MRKFECILIIDDDEINNFINKTIIERSGLARKISVEMNGKDGIEYLKRYYSEYSALPEIIFLDINMPVMDGFQFVEEYQQLDIPKGNTTIVVLSTSTNPNDKARFTGKNIDRYINKPLTTTVFAHLVKEIPEPAKPIVNTFGMEIILPNETERVEAVRKYQILDTQSDPDFNNLVLEAAQYFNVPFAFISIVDHERVWTKATSHGPMGGNIDRGMSFCSLAILQDEVTVFENAKDDPCLLANPLVHGAFGLRFYAGAPLINKDGFRIGAFGLADQHPRQFSKTDQDKLKEFASLTMQRIEHRFSVIKQF
ncbi:MAG: response regulator [Cytophagaceae bacterium]